MRIFLAGASGVIGRRLLPLLLAQGHHVTGTSRTVEGAARLTAAGATGIQLDMFDRSAVTEALAAAAPDTVIHQLTALAAGSSADNARIRVEGTRNLVDAAHTAGVGRIVAQSIAWAYQAGGQPADESTPLDLTATGPRAATVRGVQALENAAAELPDHVVLRYGTLYGPGTWYAPNALMATKLRAGELAANDAVSSFLHIEDAARAALLALDWPSGTINLVDDDPAPAHAWVPVLAKALGTPTPVRSTGRAGWERGATNATARAFGWAPHHPSWRDGFHTDLE